MFRGNELSNIYLKAGLYSDDEGWISGDDVLALARLIDGAFVNDVFQADYLIPVALECLRVVLARGVAGTREDNIRRRIAQLEQERQRTPATPAASTDGVTRAEFNQHRANADDHHTPPNVASVDFLDNEVGQGSLERHRFAGYTQAGVASYTDYEDLYGEIANSLDVNDVIPEPSSTEPPAIGTGTAGSGTAYARGNHTHDGPTSGGGQTEAQVDDQIEAYTGQTSKTGKIANDRLNEASSSQDGIVQHEDYVLIHGAVQGDSLSAAPVLTDDTLVAADSFLIEDEDVNTGSQLKRITLSEMDKRYRQQASTANPLDPASSAAQGTSDRYSRQDHRHREQSVGSGGRTENQVNDQIESYTGQANASDTFALDRIPEIGTSQIADDAVTADKIASGVIPTVPSVPALSDDNPQAPGTASPGTGTETSRDDHVHPAQVIPDAPAPVTTLAASAITVDAQNFDGNLATTDTNVQLLAQAVDDLTVSGGGSINSVTGVITSGSAPNANSISDAGLSVSITPSSATSRILISLFGGFWESGGGRSVTVYVTTSDNVQVARGDYEGNDPGGDRGAYAIANIHAPATTDPVTYKVRWNSRWVSGSPNRILASGSSPLVLQLTEVDAAGRVVGGGSGGSGGGTTTPGLSTVATDDTLTGDGSATNALSVANPKTADDNEKLAAFTTDGWNAYGAVSPLSNTAYTLFTAQAATYSTVSPINGPHRENQYVVVRVDNTYSQKNVRLVVVESDDTVVHSYPASAWVGLDDEYYLVSGVEVGVSERFQAQEYDKIAFDPNAVDLPEIRSQLGVEQVFEVSVLPEPLIPGAIYKLSSNSEIKQSFSAVLEPAQTTLYTLSVNRNDGLQVSNISFFTNAYSGSNASTYQDNAFLTLHAALPSDVTALTVEYGDEQFDRTSYTCSITAVPGGLHQYQIAGLHTSDQTLRETYHYRITYTQASTAKADPVSTPVRRGVWTGVTQTSVVQTPGTILLDEDGLIPRSAVVAPAFTDMAPNSVAAPSQIPVLGTDHVRLPFHSVPASRVLGPALSQANTRDSFLIPGLTIDSDTSYLVDVQIDLSTTATLVANKSVSSQDEATDARRDVITFSFLGADLLAQPVYDLSTNPVPGLKAGDYERWNGTTKVSDRQVTVSRNATNGLLIALSATNITTAVAFADQTTVSVSQQRFRTESIAVGTASDLTTGTSTDGVLWSAKDIADYVPDASDTAPQDVGTAAAGTSADYSRQDHVHGGGSSSGGGGFSPTLLFTVQSASTAAQAFLTAAQRTTLQTAVTAGKWFYVECRAPRSHRLMLGSAMFKQNQTSGQTSDYIYISLANVDADSVNAHIRPAILFALPNTLTANNVYFQPRNIPTSGYDAANDWDFDVYTLD